MMHEILFHGALLATAGIATFTCLVAAEKSEKVRTWIRASLLSEEFNSGEL